MADARTVILDTGRAALARAFAEGSRVTPGRFRVGSGINFVPPGNGISPSPVVVYTGPQNLIAVNIININQVRFSMTLPEDVGDFSLGNVMLDLDIDGEYVPFIWWVSDVVIPKEKFDPDDPNKVGNRFIISFIEEFINFADVISIVVTSPTFSSMPSYMAQYNVPPPEAALFQQAVVQNDSRTRTPALISRRAADNRWFGFPFLERLDNPFFGQLRGGYTGDGYFPYTGDYIWGGYFITPLVEYVSTMNCGAFTDRAFSKTIVCDPFTAG
jgi:hypothetical protein